GDAALRARLPPCAAGRAHACRPRRRRQARPRALGRGTVLPGAGRRHAARGVGKQRTRRDDGKGAIQSDAAYVGDSTMMEGWPMAAAAKLSDAAFLAILQAHPGLRDRLVSIALAVMNAEGNLKEADAIEERLVDELR